MKGTHGDPHSVAFAAAVRHPRTHGVSAAVALACAALPAAEPDDSPAEMALLFEAETELFDADTDEAELPWEDCANAEAVRARTAVRAKRILVWFRGRGRGGGMLLGGSWKRKPLRDARPLYSFS